MPLGGAPPGPWCGWPRHWAGDEIQRCGPLLGGRSHYVVLFWRRFPDCEDREDRAGTPRRRAVTAGELRLGPAGAPAPSSAARSWHLSRWSLPYEVTSLPNRSTPWSTPPASTSPGGRVAAALSVPRPHPPGGVRRVGHCPWAGRPGQRRSHRGWAAPGPMGGARRRPALPRSRTTLGCSPKPWRRRSAAATRLERRSVRSPPSRQGCSATPPGGVCCHRPSDLAVVRRNPGKLDEVRLVGWDDSTTADSPPLVGLGA